MSLKYIFSASCPAVLKAQRERERAEPRDNQRGREREKKLVCVREVRGGGKEEGEWPKLQAPLSTIQKERERETIAQYRKRERETIGGRSITNSIPQAQIQR